MPQLPQIVIVTPTLASANTGNWQTARRWAALLAGHYRVHITAEWTGGNELAMLALHARRSAASILAWRNAWPARPLLVALTGTDLYGDIATDAVMQQSLALADRLVVLNRLGLQRLSAELQAKTGLCLPSCAQRQTLEKTTRHLRVVMVGHLREEKSPTVFFETARRLQQRLDIRLDHIGGALQAELGEQARTLMRECPHYRWLGALPHAQTRARIQAAHALVHPSRIEGGATVIVEALRSGTPVLASRVDGNIGLLGELYPGYVEWGDASAWAAAIARLRDEPAHLAALQARCAQLAQDFSPAQERASLLSLLTSAGGAGMQEMPVVAPGGTAL